MTKEASPGRTPHQLKKPPDRAKRKEPNLIASQRRAALDVYGDLHLSRSSPHNTSGGPERTTKRKIDTGRVPVMSNKKRKQQRKKQEDSFQDRDRHTPESDELRALAGPDDVPSLRASSKLSKRRTGYSKSRSSLTSPRPRTGRTSRRRKGSSSKTLMSRWPRRSRLVSKLNSARPTWPVRSSSWSGSLDPLHGPPFNKHLHPSVGQGQRVWPLCTWQRRASPARTGTA